MSRHAVILAGGSGTRLWPASRRARPKQFLTLAGGETLLAATVRRARAAATDALVVTAADQADAAREAGVAVLAEPSGRNTAAALGLAAIHLRHRDPDAVMGGFPADHHVADEASFGVAVERAFAAAERADVIATIGIAPTRADTGFGYLELGAARDDLGFAVREVTRFIEKPGRADAERHVAAGHLWNAGMFFLRASRLCAELERLMPATWAGLAEIAAALPRGPAAADAAAAAVYPDLPRTSIDVGVMERTRGVVAVPGDFGWSDVGSWQAVAELTPLDAAGNAAIGDAIVIDARDNLVVTDPGTLVAVVGVSGLAVVRSGDAVLVMPRERAQDVRAVVDALTGERQRFT